MSTEVGTLLVRSSDVCGGRLQVNGTRRTVNQLVVSYTQGYAPEGIVDQYPHLTLAHVYTALAYYHANSEEIEANPVAEKIEADRLEQEYR